MLKTEYTENIAEPKIKTKKELYNSFKFHCNTLNKLPRLCKANHSYFEEQKQDH